MFRHLTSSVKYAANTILKSKEDPALPSNQLLAYWITETQRGLDAYFNDDFEQATCILTQNLDESPFHAVGYALMAYVDALLCFETEKIQIALKQITFAEQLAKQFIKKIKRKSWYSAAPADDTSSQEFLTCISFDDTHSQQAKKPRSVEIYYELVVLNCMLMSSTIQFLRNNWVEYLKAAYKLRKAYKLYEQMFESITGIKTSEYATSLKTCPSITTIIKNSPHMKASWNDKRSSLFQAPHRKISLDSLITKKRPASTIENYALEMPADPTYKTLESTLESGVFFGIGLFSLVFSLLPPKVNKILNTLGFQSSRPFALHLLQRSFKTTGLYSSLSALSLVCYYTNLSMFIHPHLLPTSLSLENVRSVLDQMKLAYPHGKMWKLLEGKLCKMEGKTRRGVEILRDARRRKTVRGEGSASVLKQSESAQLQALTVYEMGWGQIFLGDYFQAAETFFRLESMNNWSRAFYHYIATCCMFADEEYEKSALEYMQIPNMLKRKRQAGGRLLPNEVFVERKIRYWKTKADCASLTGSTLKRVVVVNPLWELIYLWNGMSQLTVDTLQDMKRSIETTLTREQTDAPNLYLLLGVCVRELGEFELADVYLRQTIKYQDDQLEDQWVIPHGLYEMAALCCFRLMKSNDNKKKLLLYSEAHDWIKKSERYLINWVQQQQQQQDPLYSDNSGDADWDSRLHVRCQLLKEKLEDYA